MLSEQKKKDLMEWMDELVALKETNDVLNRQLVVLEDLLAKSEDTSLRRLKIIQKCDETYKDMRESLDCRDATISNLLDIIDELRDFIRDEDNADVKGCNENSCCNQETTCEVKDAEPKKEEEEEIQVVMVYCHYWW